MIESFVLKLLMLTMVEANINEYVRIDTSAPELEIDQSEYNNPSTIKTNTSEKSFVTEKKSIQNDTHYTLSDEVTDKEKVEMENENINHVNQPRHSRESNHMDSIAQDTKLQDYEGDDFISVATKDIPIQAIRFGPERQPDKDPIFNGIGPKGIDQTDSIKCDEFSKSSRFNLHSILEDVWFCFYRWAPDNTPMHLEFIAPTSWEMVKMREFLDKQVSSPHEAVNWTSRMVIMIDLIYNISSLLVERPQNGKFWLYPIRPNYTGTIAPEDVRLKQTSDNKYIGFVICRDQRAYILSRRNEIPSKKNIPGAAATIGWRGRDGRSYLYQGHKWLPISEMDEDEYWGVGEYETREELPPDPEPYNPENDPVEIFGKKHNHNFGRSG